MPRKRSMLATRRIATGEPESRYPSRRAVSHVFRSEKPAKSATGI
jgi:hypothetical protein